jgi:ubiquitin-like protein Pup
MATEQKKQSTKKTEADVDGVLASTPAPLDFDIDDMLDAIDDVLEENAEEFVAGYIQKGGQ